jgi:parvulin-like peptidyl-prolyl isomerase
MKKFCKAGIALLLTATMMLPLAGCSLKDEAAGSQYTDDEVVAKVGDAEITLGDYQELFNYYLQYYQSYGSDPTTSKESLESFQDDIMNTLLREKVIPYQAKKLLGEELTAEQQTELDSRVEKELKSWDDYFREQAQSEYEADNTVDVEARVKELYEQEAQYSGTDYDGLIGMIKESVTNSYYEELLRDNVFTDLSVTDEEAKKWYDDSIAADTKSYDEDPASYFDRVSEFETYGGQPVTYSPGGYGRVMHILVAPDTELGEDYTTKTIEMDELLTEYGRLSMESEYTKDSAAPIDNSVRLAEIMTEYYGLKDEADALWNEHYADSKTKIEEAYSKLQSGTDFAEVMKEYTQDTDFAQYEVYSQKGKLISSEYDNSYWSEAVINAYKALTPGSYSPIFKDEEGYHIIYFVAEEQKGADPFEDMKENIVNMLLSDKQAQEWETLMAEWTADKSVTVYTEKIRGVGA